MSTGEINISPKITDPEMLPVPLMSENNYDTRDVDAGVNKKDQPNKNVADGGGVFNKRVIILLIVLAIVILLIVLYLYVYKNNEEPPVQGLPRHVHRPGLIPEQYSAVNPPVNHPVNHPVNPPVNHPVNTPVNPSVNHQVNHPVNNQVNNSVNNSVNPPMKKAQLSEVATEVRDILVESDNADNYDHGKLMNNLSEDQIRQMLMETENMARQNRDASSTDDKELQESLEDNNSEVDSRYDLDKLQDMDDFNESNESDKKTSVKEESKQVNECCGAPLKAGGFCKRRTPLGNRCSQHMNVT
jgi:flagellar basal body-associated protein FliL